MKSRKLNDIKNYCIVNGRLFTSNESRVINNHSSNEVFDKYKFDSASLMSINDFLIIPITPRQTFIHNSVERETTILDGSCMYKNYSNENIIIKLSNFEYTNFLIKIFNLKSLSFEFEVNHLFSKCNFFNYWNNILQYVDENITIIALHLPTETTLWQYSVADLGAEKVSKILGVFGQTLVVVGQIKENTFVLFGLDVQSGQLLWKHDTVFERNSDGRISRVKLNLPYAHTLSNTIIIFEAGFYIEIEGSSGQILKWIDVFKSPFHYNDLTMDAYAFDISQADDDHIYFRTSVPTYGMYTGAGIFNRKTDKLEFLEIIKNEKGNPVIIGPLKIQATKEKYYVLDTQNTLHIFEREDETPDLNQ